MPLNLINFKKQLIKIGFYISFYSLVSTIPFDTLNSISFLDKMIMKAFQTEIVTSIPLSLIRKNLIIVFIAILVLNIASILLKKVSYFDYLGGIKYVNTTIKIKLLTKTLIKFLFSVTFIYVILRDYALVENDLLNKFKVVLLIVLPVWFIANIFVEYKTKSSILNILLKIK